MSLRADIVILGGGLSGGLIARALHHRRPDVSLLLVEGGETLGGNHVWSFFEGDVAGHDRWLVDPFVVHRWPAYDVRFPAYARTIAQAYHSIESETFDAVLRAELGERIVRATVAEARADGVTLSDGRTIAGAVIDARGAGDLSRLDLGWQKFVGLSLRTPEPHGVERPIVMDARVDQYDGYRFVYVLPFGPHELFVEDTYYSDTRALDVEAVRARVLAYAAAQGWRAQPGNRVETGVLPVVIGGDFAAYWASTGEGAKAGMRALLCHPTTGYSLPDAVRLARAIATAPDLSPIGLERATRGHAAAAWDGRRFYRLLDAMLFRAAAPSERYRVLERFYRLPEPLIARFYAGQSRYTDMARVLAGKPPVPILRAVRALLGPVHGKS